MVIVLDLFSFFLAVFAHMIGQKGRAMRGWPKTRGQIALSAVEPTLRQHQRPYPRRDYTDTMYGPRGARAKRRSVNRVTASSPGPPNHPLGGASLPGSDGRTRLVTPRLLRSLRAASFLRSTSEAN
jgi:hypothetical protein